MREDFFKKIYECANENINIIATVVYLSLRNRLPVLLSVQLIENIFALTTL